MAKQVSTTTSVKSYRSTECKVCYCKFALGPTDESDICSACWQLKESVRIAAEHRAKKLSNRQNSTQKWLEKMDIPKRFLDCSFENYETNVSIGNIKDSISDGENILMYGTAGSGKTHLSVAMLRLAGTTLEGEFEWVSTPNLISCLRKTAFESCDVAILNEVDSIYRCDFLFIDDIGTEKLSDFVLQEWYRLIDTRYGNMQKTVFTSNLSPTDLANQYGARLASRICSGKSFEIKGSDYRAQNK